MKVAYLGVALVAASLTVSGCASRPSSIAPLAISPSEYSHLSCDERRFELEDARERERTLSRQQNNAATADAAGVFLLLVPVGSVFGSDVEGELAQAMGEVRALERSIDMDCRG